MTLYNVHLYREMRLVFLDVEANSPEEAAASCREFPDEAASGPAVDCDGETFAALVDVQGDVTYAHTVLIDFEAERTRKAGSLLLSALQSCELQLKEYVHWHHAHAGGCSVEIESAWEHARTAIAEAEASGIRCHPSPEADAQKGLQPMDAREFISTEDPIKPYDNYEISPCRRFEEPDAPGTFWFEVCEPDEADVWTLYGHLQGEGVEAIGDFPSRDVAEAVYSRITGQPFPGSYQCDLHLRRMHLAAEAFDLLRSATDELEIWQLPCGDEGDPDTMAILRDAKALFARVLQ